MQTIKIFIFFIKFNYWRCTSPTFSRKFPFKKSNPILDWTCLVFYDTSLARGLIIPTNQETGCLIAARFYDYKPNGPSVEDPPIQNMVKVDTIQCENTGSKVVKLYTNIIYIALVINNGSAKLVFWYRNCTQVAETMINIFFLYNHCEEMVSKQ